MKAARESYFNPQTLPLPFCPGCGHHTVLEQLNHALVALQPDPRKLVLVSDIGCGGLADQFFLTNALHGLHGRSVTYATGIKLANPEVTVVVLMGDGGCGIGGHHLLNAARRNIGITVVVLNNFNFGMTGGQHSVSTPPGGVTISSTLGVLERPMDICGTVMANGATFVARTTTFDPELPELLARAISHDGFALVDVGELCSAYYAATNRLNRESMHEILDGLGLGLGVLVEETRSEYSRAYRDQTRGLVGNPAMPSRPIETRWSATLDRSSGILVAGAAGKKTLSAAGVLARGGVLSGLWANQKNIIPITVKAGFSVAEVILSPDPILYPGIGEPDILVILFPEGLARVRARFGDIPSGAVLYIASELMTAPEVSLGSRGARTVPLDFAALGALGRRKDRWTLLALAAMVQDQGLYPLDALRAAAGQGERGSALVDEGVKLLG
ncbi:MAG: thiamine pyrophosphate-dependent enzyme [Gemmatimonadota bacterium]